MDGQAEEMIQATKAQTYERFKTTVQHSLGDNVSWNSLAFLFYTTKGVIAAVGKSNKLAGDAKEMTLRYFSDKFAKWIMDQGGFVSIQEMLHLSFMKAISVCGVCVCVGVCM